jgi:two-component SAPR family response regulator
VLGSFEATVDDQPIALEGRAPRRLLDLLAAVSSAGPNGLPEHVAESGIWPESDDAHHALETSLYRLRRLLRHDVVVHHDRALRIDRRRCWVDAIALDVQLDRVSARLLRRDLEGAVSALNAAVRLYRGPLLAVRDEAWVTAARARIRRRLRRSFGDVAAHGAVEGSRAALAMAVGLDDALGPPDASFSPQP